MLDLPIPNDKANEHYCARRGDGETGSRRGRSDAGRGDGHQPHQRRHGVKCTLFARCRRLAFGGGGGHADGERAETRTSDGGTGRRGDGETGRHGPPTITGMGMEICGHVKNVISHPSAPSASPADAVGRVIWPRVWGRQSARPCSAPLRRRGLRSRRWKPAMGDDRDDLDPKPTPSRGDVIRVLVERAD